MTPRMTPGGWELETRADGSWHLSKGDFVIASRGPCEHCAEESIANAHMLHAAAKLYQALKTFQNFNMTLAARQQAQAEALAMAEGRFP